jgi:putative heme-binding domain-containing protein
MFGEGGAIGPELTGSQRANLDYVLENVIDPSALVAQEYQLNTLSLADGRVLSGIIVQSNDTALVVQTVNEKLTVPRDDVLDRTVSPISMMPEGLFEKLSDQQVLELVAYLAAPGQVELPAGARVGEAPGEGEAPAEPR